MRLSLSEAAKILGKSVSQIHRLVREGVVPGEVEGRRVMVDVERVASCFCPSCGAMRRDRGVDEPEEDLGYPVDPRLED